MPTAQKSRALLRNSLYHAIAAFDVLLVHYARKYRRTSALGFFAAAPRREFEFNNNYRLPPLRRIIHAPHSLWAFDRFSFDFAFTIRSSPRMFLT
jgi:hypothetical protein